VVLATTAYEDEVWKSLEEAGCEPPEVWDDSVPGVPHGWRLFRGVKPMHAVPARNEAHLLNALCPLADVEPHFIGGIRLEGRNWLSGYPPRIRFTGERDDSFRVKIDDQDAHPTDDGGFEAPGWDNVGEHCLWFGGQSRTYALRVMDEAWECWQAHDFGIGAAICGASIQRLDNQRWHQVRVPSTNPLLVGAVPGQVFCCHPRDDVRCETLLALVPFPPIWALPIDPIHCDKRSSRVVMLRAMEPVGNTADFKGDRFAVRAVAKWIAAIRDAGRKQLQLAVASDNSGILWQRYRALAKQIGRRMR
jgi:hypothetical protein